jgi:uncharacterized protein YqgV (UPF0045/DUF77 family)
MIAQFNIFPLGEAHTRKDTTQALTVLNRCGITPHQSPTGTSIEGSWEEVMSALRACHEAAKRRHRDVITAIVIYDHREDRKPSVERLTGSGRRIAPQTVSLRPVNVTSDPD